MTRLTNRDYFSREDVIVTGMCQGLSDWHYRSLYLYPLRLLAKQRRLFATWVVSTA